VIGLLGLCRFHDVDKIPFKLAYWLHLIQLWCYALYMGFLLYLWDGNYKSGTLNLAAAVSPPKSSSFLQISSATAAVAGTTAPSANTVWFAMQATQLWFMGITFVLILFTVLYLYGSLRMRCKRMGKWGVAMTSFLLLCLSCATIVFAALTLRFHSQFRASWQQWLPLGAQMLVAALVLVTCVYQMYVSTQVSKLQLAAKSRFNDLLIMTLVAFICIGVCHYTYYLALQTSPRINLLYLTALSATVSQVLLAGFGMMVLAWRLALPDEYTALPTMEKFGLAADEEVTPFVPTSSSDPVLG